MCKTQQSLQQMIYNLYNAIVFAEVKGYAMILFGHHILQYIKGGEYFKVQFHMRIEKNFQLVYK